jgi:hypothetical protein
MTFRDLNLNPGLDKEEFSDIGKTFSHEGREGNEVGFVVQKGWMHAAERERSLARSR